MIRRLISMSTTNSQSVKKSLHGYVKSNFLTCKLNDERHDDVVDFWMEHFVARELTHTISGMTENKEAMSEYRDILDNTLRHPSIHVTVCCANDGSAKPRVAAVSIMKLIDKSKSYEDIEQMHCKTELLKRYFRILQHLNVLYPVPKLMDAAGIDTFFDDVGLAVHPDYYRRGLCNELIGGRLPICKEYGVRMMGGWITSVGTLRATLNNGWHVSYEISYAELGKILGVTFKNMNAASQYLVCNVKNNKKRIEKK